MSSTRPKNIDSDFLELVFTVVKEFSGWRADRFVSYKIPRLSRTRVQRILKEFAFDENGKAVKPNRILRDGERITVYKRPPDEPEVTRTFDVIFEDEWLLCVNKPACLPVHPTARYLKNTLTALLEERYGPDRPALSHRLDSETSGVLMCAKGIDAERKTKKLFAQRQITKTYLAVVAGIPSPPKGRIEVPISPDPNSVIKVKMYCTNPDGLPSLTEYEVLKKAHNRSLVRLKPRTGRQHQLRTHLAFIGHPIIGDKMYGPDENLFLDYIDEGLTEEIEERAGHSRQALHAHSIAFEHPFTGKSMTIECPLPDDIQSLID